MQNYNYHSIVAKIINGRPLAAVYHGLRLVWIAVRSCFGSGVWIDEKPWIDDEFWKDNK